MDALNYNTSIHVYIKFIKTDNTEKVIDINVNNVSQDDINKAFFGESKFVQNDNIKEIEILDGITEIYDSCFVECSNLESVKFDNKTGNNIILDDTCFHFCFKLKSVELKNVTKIGDGVFTGSLLPSIDLINVTEIGDDCFCDTICLKEIICHNKDVYKKLVEQYPDIIVRI